MLYRDNHRLKTECILDSYEYGYDPAGRLNTVAKDGSLIRDYSYDAFGNRTSLSENGIKTVYEYNKANQLLSADSADGGITFAYDKRGNIVEKNTSQGVAIKYTYGAANRLVQATKNENGKSQTANYVYNGLGMRVGRMTDAGSVDYILDQTKIYSNMLEKADKETSEEYVWFNNELVMAGGERTLTGRLFSVERAEGSNGKAFAYDEFGLPMSAGAAMGFTGYIQDEISDTYFAQAREYLPEIGRFAGRDILKGHVENPQSLNEYAYCHNNPVGFVDFNGMAEESTNKDIVDFTAKYIRNQTASVGISHSEITIEYGIKKHTLTKNYNNEYAALKEDLQMVRQQTGNTQAGTGRLGWKTKRYNAGMANLQDEQALAYTGRVRELTARNVGMAGLKGAASGGAADVALGLYDDYNSGMSRSKMGSNAAVNFAFGAGEGFIIGAAFAVNPGLGIIAIVGVGAYEFLFDNRQQVKDWINSLD